MDPDISTDGDNGGMSPRTATVRRVVEWSDTDASGHHHNRIIIRLEEACERVLMTELGVRDEFFASAPRVRHEVDYLGPLAFAQEATCALRVERVGTSSVTFAFEVWGEEFEGAPRHPAARGRVVGVHVAPGDSSSSPWTPTLRAALESCLVES